MKVLFVSSWFPNRVTPLNGDFVERHALAVSQVCKTAVLHVITDSKVHGRFLEIHEIQKNSLFEVIIYIRRISIGPESAARLITHLLYALGYFIGYWIVRREIGPPDIIHANIIVPVSKVALLFHRLLNIPYIISEHWTIYLTDERSKLLHGYAKPVTKAFALVPVTRNLQDSLISFGYRGRYYVVPNVVDTGIFKPSGKRTGSEKKILHVSSMKEDHKNISGIIRAIRMLRDKREDFTFTFVGNATAQQKEMVTVAGLTDCIIMAGEVEHRKVADYMRQSDMLVMFSNVENLPCVILEALACGLPVLSTRVGGISEWLNDQNGILIDRGDENALYQGMNYLLDHSHEYSSQLLHEYAVKYFSPGVIANRFLAIYNEALNTNNKG
ncbi:MAG TPA: glycosyltransferase [Bacteroidales bacterium]|nr:glycosyltransferase [Bacteroidales bacterium]